MRAARQVVAMALGLLLWSLLGHAVLWTLVLAYVAALCMLHTGAATRVLQALSRSQLLGVALLLSAPGLALGWRSRALLLESEGLHGLGTRVADRRRLEALPAIAPPLLAADRAQTFFVAAPGGVRVSVRLGARMQPLQAEALGHGLFRIDYDPRRDGLPLPAAGPLTAKLDVDGSTYTRTLTAVTPLAHPRWLARSPDAALAATVSEETDELFVIAAHGLRARIPVGDGPMDCAFLDATHVLVSHRDDARLWLVDVQSGAQTRSWQLGPRQGRVAVSPDGTRIAVGMRDAQPGLMLIEAATADAAPLRVPLAAAADWLAFGADAGTLVVSVRSDATLRRLRRAGTGYVVDATLQLGRPAVTLARSADGSQLFVATTDFRANAEPQLGNHFVQDQILTVDIAHMQVVGRTLTARRSERQSKPGDVDRGISPMGLFAAADGSLSIAFAGSDELWRQRPGASAPEILDLVDTPLHVPHGITELADGTRVVTSPVYGTIGIFPSGAQQPRVIQLAHDDAWLLAHDRDALARRVGERGFYEGTRAGIACQSCHMHADSDEAAYNLGDHLLVPTLSVRGLLHTAPYLRDGSYARLADLDELAQTLYRGYLRNQAARGETLERYISSLPRREHPRGPGARDRARERRGLSAFVKARCDTCHAPPAFTNLGELPMRTLFPDEAARLTDSTQMLDTPSLLSLAASAPYLSDGRAQTLDEVLTRYNRRNLHGDTRALTATERADLIAFLSSL